MIGAQSVNDHATAYDVVCFDHQKLSVGIFNNSDYSFYRKHVWRRIGFMPGSLDACFAEYARVDLGNSFRVRLLRFPNQYFCFNGKHLPGPP